MLSFWSHCPDLDHGGVRGDVTYTIISKNFNIKNFFLQCLLLKQCSPV